MREGLAHEAGILEKSAGSVGLEGGYAEILPLEFESEVC